MNMFLLSELRVNDKYCRIPPLIRNLPFCNPPTVCQKYSGEFCMDSIKILELFCSCTQENVRQTSFKCFGNRKWSPIHYFYFYDMMCLLLVLLFKDDRLTSSLNSLGHC